MSMSALVHLTPSYSAASRMLFNSAREFSTNFRFPRDATAAPRLKSQCASSIFRANETRITFRGGVKGGPVELEVNDYVEYQDGSRSGKQPIKRPPSGDQQIPQSHGQPVPLIPSGVIEKQEYCGAQRAQTVERQEGPYQLSRHTPSLEDGLCARALVSPLLCLDRNLGSSRRHSSSATFFLMRSHVTLIHPRSPAAITVPA